MAEKSRRLEAEESDGSEEEEEAVKAPVRTASVTHSGKRKEIDPEERDSLRPPGVTGSWPQPSLIPASPKTVSANNPSALSSPVSNRTDTASPQGPVAPVLPTTSGVNLFANDGSFLELFKKRMEQAATGSSEESQPAGDKKPEAEKRKPIGFVGKRRGGAKLALKTGMVAKKPKTEEEEEVLSNKGGAWAQYMAEVKKYKAHQCSDDDKTRPLVK
ncbi:telomerase RNA component interacting RNase [Spea bombifrons]|uniref:telomerase RNA component interacting RNase n=1 Tax=Spea bombifrons TaxID=233779 RepID=UPI0023499CAE|nr:telomerase RNA component interacting RNase [Spea bombifrons]